MNNFRYTNHTKQPFNAVIYVHYMHKKPYRYVKIINKIKNKSVFQGNQHFVSTSLTEKKTLRSADD